jgi:hypothetical protein
VCQRARVHHLTEKVPVRRRVLAAELAQDTHESVEGSLTVLDVVDLAIRANDGVEAAAASRVDAHRGGRGRQSGHAQVEEGNKLALASRAELMSAGDRLRSDSPR